MQEARIVLGCYQQGVGCDVQAVALFAHGFMLDDAQAGSVPLGGLCEVLQIEVLRQFGATVFHTVGAGKVKRPVLPLQLLGHGNEDLR